MSDCGGTPTVRSLSASIAPPGSISTRPFPSRFPASGLCTAAWSSPAATARRAATKIRTTATSRRESAWRTRYPIIWWRAPASVSSFRPPLASAPAPEAPAQLLRPYPQLMGLQQTWGSLAHPSYHSMQLKFRKRYRSGLQMQAAYTWAKMLDDFSSVGGYGQTYPGYTDFNNRRLDKSLS